MAKGKNAQKAVKKEATKSIKEKRAEKKAKAAAKRDQVFFCFLTKRLPT